MAGAISATAQTNFTVLKLFTAQEGFVPVATLADGKDGAFYGLTAGGGLSNEGTIFMLQRDGSRYATLKSFAGPDGGGPYYGGLVLSTNGALFGTTYSGGLSNFGTVFRINKNGSGFQLLHSFTGASDSKNPSGTLIQGLDGALYGVTSYGDGANRGTVFKINQDGNGYTILHTFTGNPDGQQPQGRLLQIPNGVLFGTASFGGSASVPGVVFSLNSDGSGYGLLHVFGGTGDGRDPTTGLTLGSDGALYGTTYSGGTAGYGTVFTMNTDGSGYSVLHNFPSTAGDGQSPNTELVEGSDGALYGTTYAGGAIGGGTVFKMAKDGTGYTILHQCGSSPDFYEPNGLLLGSNGVFYATTQYGGNNSAGCAYILSPSPVTPRVLSLSMTNGSSSILFATTTAIQYDVLRSTNFSSWSVLSTMTAPFDGQLVFTDLNPPQPAAFYRLHQH